MASQLDPPGETLIVEEYSYCPPSTTTSPRSTTTATSRRIHHPNPQRRGCPDAPSTLDLTHNGTATTATMTATMPNHTASSSSNHFPTFKDQTDDVPSQLHIANPREHISHSLATTMTCVQAVPIQTQTNGFPPAPFLDQFRDKAYLSELERLQNDIQQIDSLSDCRDMYRTPSFTDCLALIRSAQKEFVDANGPSEAKMVWAQKWAETKNLPRTTDTEWAWILDHCRKTCLTLVYRMCDLAVKDDSTLAILCDDNYGIVIETIISLCLVMDRANCLYHMGDDASNLTGLVWYRKDAHEALPKRHQNPRGGLMNKRLMWLFDHDVLNEQTNRMLKPLTELTLPPRLRQIEP